MHLYTCLLRLCVQVSHYPPGYRQDKIVGMGLNEDELKQNPVLYATLALFQNAKQIAIAFTRIQVKMSLAGKILHQFNPNKDC